MVISTKDILTRDDLPAYLREGKLSNQTEIFVSGIIPLQRKKERKKERKKRKKERKKEERKKERKERKKERTAVKKKFFFFFFFFAGWAIIPS